MSELLKPQGCLAGADTAAFGVLLVNLGTPDGPTPRSIRRYLAEFLSDPRVVHLPRWLWLSVLYGFILPLRPRRLSHSYQQAWMAEGSPLRVFCERQARGLKSLLKDKPVELAMTYGQPSLKEGLLALRAQGAKRVLVLPLYPQYSATTTAAVFDRVSALFKKCPHIPSLRFVLDYHDKVGYIQVVAGSITDYWAQHGKPDQLLFSFHGIPEAYYLQGDPYPEQCQVSARLIAEALGLEATQWQVSFQSRFGRAKWIGPSTIDTVTQMGRAGAGRVDVVAPGFSADCLETVEELNILNRAAFLSAGGKVFHYIPALNDREDHLQFLAKLVATETAGW